jgi:hypothetical protein
MPPNFGWGPQRNMPWPYMECFGASLCRRWIKKCHFLTPWGWLWVYCDQNTGRIVIPLPQYPLYASQFGLGTPTQHAMALYGVPWGLTVWPVGEKVSLFDSVRVVMGVVWPKYVTDNNPTASVSFICLPIWVGETNTTCYGLIWSALGPHCVSGGWKSASFHLIEGGYGCIET